MLLTFFPLNVERSEVEKDSLLKAVLSLSYNGITTISGHEREIGVSGSTFSHL